MSQNADVHNNSRYIPLLAPLTIGAAVAATATTPVTGLGGMKSVILEAKFLYGAGGTNTNAYVQTSLDGGVSWIDIANFFFETTAANKVAAVNATLSVITATPVDGSLASNTVLNGILGDRLRLKYVTTGTYTGATSVAVYAHVKG